MEPLNNKSVLSPENDISFLLDPNIKYCTSDTSFGMKYSEFKKYSTDSTNIKKSDDPIESMTPSLDPRLEYGEYFYFYTTPCIHCHTYNIAFEYILPRELESQLDTARKEADNNDDDKMTQESEILSNYLEQFETKKDQLYEYLENRFKNHSSFLRMVKCKVNGWTVFKHNYPFAFDENPCKIDFKTGMIKSRDFRDSMFTFSENRFDVKTRSFVYEIEIFTRSKCPEIEAFFRNVFN